MLKVLLQQPPLLWSVEERQRGPALELKLGQNPAENLGAGAERRPHRVSSALQVGDVLHRTWNVLEPTWNVLEQDERLLLFQGESHVFVQETEVALDFSPPASSFLRRFSAENT